MSLHYIIDGYNVIKQVDFLTGKKLRTGREDLVRFIERYRPHGSIRNEVTVVFDGKPEISSPPMNSPVRVVFSTNRSADDKIKFMVEHSRNSKLIVVVSDDKEIVFYCRSLGARVLSVKAFLDNSLLSKRKTVEEDEEEKSELDSSAAAAITEYLKKIWIK
jgi:predicted RNA-binding protein with PIN domain